MATTNTKVVHGIKPGSIVKFVWRAKGRWPQSVYHVIVDKVTDIGLEGYFVTIPKRLEQRKFFGLFPFCEAVSIKVLDNQ